MESKINKLEHERNDIDRQLQSGDWYEQVDALARFTGTVIVYNLHQTVDTDKDIARIAIARNISSVVYNLKELDKAMCSLDERVDLHDELCQDYVRRLFDILEIHLPRDTYQDLYDYFAEVHLYLKLK
jgi:hypothetical protein|tara:strand:+ start:76 stop:459 length:384 start_codon:yes stop_codon:yes gene_type:complete